MTAKEKMIAGKAYVPWDEELVQDRIRTRELLDQVNRSTMEERYGALCQLLGKCGEDAYVEPVFACDYGYNITVGDFFYANYGCVILDCGPVTIGNQVLLGPNVQIYAVNHPLDPDYRRQGYEYSIPVTIGNNVWLGGGAIVLPGVTIGDDSVIAAGSVVSKDVPAGVLAAGNPCRVIRELLPRDRERFEREYLAE